MVSLASLPRGHSTWLFPSGDLIFFHGTGSDDVTNQEDGEAMAVIHAPGLRDTCAPGTQEWGGGGERGKRGSKGEVVDEEEEEALWTTGSSSLAVQTLQVISF